MKEGDQGEAAEDADSFEGEEPCSRLQQDNSTHTAIPIMSKQASPNAEPDAAATAPSLPPLTSPPISGLLQLRALTRKNYIIKRRSPFSTFCELLSPVGMALILVTGYHFAEIITTPSAEYAGIDVDVPGVWGGLLERGVCSLTNQTLPFCNTTNSTLSGVGNMFGMANNNATQSPSNANQEEEPFEDDNDNNSNLGGSGFTTLTSSQTLLDSILTSPLPIPTLSQYISLSTILSTTFFNDTTAKELLQRTDVGRRFGNLLTLGTVHVSPKDAHVTQRFVEWVNETHPLLVANGTLNVKLHDNEEQALEYVMGHLEERTWVLLDLSQAYASPQDTSINNNNNNKEQTWLEKTSVHNVQYKIRMNYTTLPNTNEIVDWTAVGLDPRYQQYYLSGFLTWMRELNQFALEQAQQTLYSTTSNNGTNATLNAVLEVPEACTPPAQLQLWSLPMPTPITNLHTFYTGVGYLFGLALAMGFLFPMSRLVKSIVEEKETRMKQTLQILGVAPWAYGWSWMVVGYTVFLVNTVLVVVTLSGSVLQHSNVGWVLLYFWLFGASIVSFSLFVSAFLSRAKLAAIVGPVALFATLMPRWIFYGSNREESIGGKMLVSLLPCSAFAFGADVLVAYEASEIGVQSWNLWEGSYSFGTSLGFLALDAVVYAALGWYLDLVLPSQFGVARPWYFFCMPGYWRSFWGGRRRDGSSASTDTVGCCEEVVCQSPAQNFEKVGPEYDARVVIRDLVKRYKKKSPPAVNRLNLCMYEDQITCLLGHNGAGKTTTISVLTGLFPPTSGDCDIYGHSISSDMQLARRSMGICPQHNVLFSDLTVAEHLRVFQQIKGIHPTDENIRQRAEEVGLGDKLHAMSGSLSGGMKRKLCLAMALCGDPKFVLLDEPTSGMDPYSRRATWDLLRRSKSGRVTVLTTHFMDEAEFLADRIAVMKSGKLQCCGSALFLKKRFGVGYSLSVVVDDDGSSPSNGDSVDVAEKAVLLGASRDTPSSASSLDKDLEAPFQGKAVATSASVSEHRVEAIRSFLAKFVPEAQLVRQSGKELTFRFPNKSTEVFPALFEAFEKVRADFGIGGYGLSNTSLEEVFLRLADEEDVATRESSEVDPEVLHLEDGFVNPVSSDEDEKILSTHTVSQKDDAHVGALTTEKNGLHENRVFSASQRSLTKKRTPSDDANLEYLGWFGQIRTLLWKRARVQRRDFKGAFFMIVLPAILIALVLLVLRIDVPLAGPPIDLSLDLYKSTPAGEGTQVPVGGTGNIANQTYENVSSSLVEEFPFAQFERVSQTQTSQGMSNYLLETHSEPHSARLGAYVFDDSIDLNLKVDWDAIKRPFENNTMALLQALLFISPQLGVDPIQTIDGARRLQSAGILRVLQTSNMTTEITNETISGPARNESLTGIVTNETNPFGANISTIMDGDAFAWLSNATSIWDILDGLQAEGVVLPMWLANATSVFDAMENLSTLLTNSNITVFPNAPELLANMTNIVPFDTLNVSVSDIWDSLIQGNATQLSDIVRTIALNSTSLVNALNDLPNFEEIMSNFSQTLGETEFGSRFGVLLDQNATLLEILSDPTLVSIVSQAALDAGFSSILPSGIVTYQLAIPSTASIIHNTSSPHAVAAFNQAYMQYQYKQCTRDMSSSIAMVNHPLPITAQQSIEIRMILSIFASLFVLIPFCFIPAAFIVFHVKERVCKSKHVQIVSGVDLSAFWVAHYIWDMVMYSLLTVLIMFVFFMYGRDSAQVFVGDAESFFCTFLLTLGYGVSSIPLAYLLSRRFKNHSSAQIAILGLFFLFGFVAVNAHFIMSNIEQTKAFADGLLYIFRISPSYNIGDGLINLSASFVQRSVLGSGSRPLDWDVCGQQIALLWGMSLPFFFVLLFLEYSEDGGSGGWVGRQLRRFRNAVDYRLMRWHGVEKTQDGKLLLDDGLDSEDAEDTDVAEERHRVENHRKDLAASAAVLLSELWKIYPASRGVLATVFAAMKRKLGCCCGKNDQRDTSSLPKRAVRGLSTAVLKGETFGLLGMNGAGKSSTLAILTGDITPTSGSAFVAGYDVSGDTPGGVAKARKRIGFCPQVDPLLDLMTGRETLHMFGRLRGIPRAQLHELVSCLMDDLTLTPHADKPAQSYSGGNKRKLSLGVALIGNPDVLFIDEASSGMDPGARRKMWELISQVSENRSVVLTTHSMEEAEALCTRLTIMVNGRMRCLGSVQHLKTTYVSGYTLELQLQSGVASEAVEAVKRHVVETALPTSSLVEEYSRFLRFSIPGHSVVCDTKSLGLGEVFGVLESMKRDPRLRVEDYALSQCTLEQVFINFAKAGEDVEAEEVD